MSVRTGESKFGFYKKEEREKVVYLSIFTPLKDYLNIKLPFHQWENISKGLKKLTFGDNPNMKYVMEFTYKGKEIVLMPETLLNSIIEYNVYEQHWWGLKKIK